MAVLDWQSDLGSPGGRDRLTLICEGTLLNLDCLQMGALVRVVLQSVSVCNKHILLHLVASRDFVQLPLFRSFLLYFGQFVAQVVHSLRLVDFSARRSDDIRVQRLIEQLPRFGIDLRPVLLKLNVPPFFLKEPHLQIGVVSFEILGETGPLDELILLYLS